MPQVYYASDIVDAHLAKQFLEQNGIKARVSGDMLSQAKGELPLGMATAPTVWVAEDNVETAQELIAKFEEERETLDLQPEWVCPNCSSENPANFEQCWSCERDRPEVSGESTE